MPFRRGPMEPGDRIYRVRLEQRDEADNTDSSGAPTDEPWTTLVDNVPVSKVDLSGRERYMADQESAPYDSRWEMAYMASMDPLLIDVPKLRRLVHFSRTYDIVRAEMIGMKEGVELLTLTSTKRPT